MKQQLLAFEHVMEGERAGAPVQGGAPEAGHRPLSAAPGPGQAEGRRPAAPPYRGGPGHQHQC